MSTPVSAAAAANRENARTNDGRFETKPHGEAVGVALAAATSHPKPITATVIFERWDGRDNAIEVGRTEFDASRLLAELTVEQRGALHEMGDYESLDNLFHEGVSRGLLPAHEDPFTVRVAMRSRKHLRKTPAILMTQHPSPTLRDTRKPF
ncbi:hypothetical protein [Arthrobacter sp. A2-55]|uniref:hypothetical protein n=1 Tax=Arthrobacter sp. A2-55 TaxID=2897337 RepID=UPI0021CD557A|nr:hypothetical protein [Arthrobacter sp. A2-55]MCU6479015.1 hypothetical protein [Arthrobacter sp. A2-55]